MESLEDKVQRLETRISELHSSNAALRNQIAGLEFQLFGSREDHARERNETLRRVGFKYYSTAHDYQDETMPASDN